MIVQIPESMDSYIDKTNEITDALRSENGPILQALHAFDDYFRKVLWRDGHNVPPVAMMLSMNAYMLFLAGSRVAMTGHASATFPVLRASLESACYAYLIAKTPALGPVWTDRHKGEAGKKACRRAFGSAVSAVATDVEREQPGGGEWLSEAYELAIDFGAHPNLKSVMGHVSIHPDDPVDAYHRVNLGGLYGHDHWRTRQMIVGCLDFGLAIAVVLTRSLPSPDQEHMDALQALSDRKNQVGQDITDGLA